MRLDFSPTSAPVEPGTKMQVRVQVKVKPKSRQSSFEAQADGSFIAHLKSPPVDGKANEELIALAARHFGLRLAQVEIASGASGRLKQLRLRG